MQDQKTGIWPRYYSCFVWLIAASFFFYKYLIQVSPSVMTSDLMQTFHVSGAGLGNLSAFYFYAYLCMQIPVGIMLDKYSPRLLTTLAIFLCSISTLLFSHTDSLIGACLTRALMGAGAAFAAVSCFKLAATWFSPKRFAFISGLFMTAAMMGAVGGQMPLSLLVQNLGWRGALQIVGFIGILLGCIYFIIIRDKPSQPSHPISSHPPAIQSLKYILRNTQAWLLSFYSGLAFAPVSVFGGLWGVPFLETAHGLSKTEAALAASTIFVGFAIGAPTSGWLSDYMGKRKPILYYGTALALVCLSLVLYLPSLSILIIMMLLALFGFGASGFFTSFAMIRELFPVGLVATVLGIMNTFDSVCEALFEPFVGALLDLTWTGTLINNVRQFSLSGYRGALLVLPLSLILALFTLIFIQETHCTSFEEK